MKIATLASSLLATTSLLLACGQVAHAADKTDKAVWDTDDTAIIKKSRNNICHDKSDPSFAQTEHFRAYKTMKDCVDSGGKRAKN
ncbi:MAG TPA: hypothetical protein VEZ88_08770 [Steroidobacteraceae bacterium]|nr:hypothetical protein [Steroidobacteraceae bacterium]